MTVEQQAEALLNEAWNYAPSGSSIQENQSIRIALWCAKNIAANTGFSGNDEYWKDVISYLNNKLIS